MTLLVNETFQDVIYASNVDQHDSAMTAKEELSLHADAVLRSIISCRSIDLSPSPNSIVPYNPGR